MCVKVALFCCVWHKNMRRMFKNSSCIFESFDPSSRLLAVNGNRSISSPLINEKYQIGKVIGDGNFAVVKECVER